MLDGHPYLVVESANSWGVCCSNRASALLVSALNWAFEQQRISKVCEWSRRWDLVKACHPKQRLIYMLVYMYVNVYIYIYNIHIQESQSAISYMLFISIYSLNITAFRAIWISQDWQITSGPTTAQLFPLPLRPGPRCAHCWWTWQDLNWVTWPCLISTFESQMYRNSYSTGIPIIAPVMTHVYLEFRSLSVLSTEKNTKCQNMIW